MKKLFTILFLASSLTLTGKTYYVAPDGKDTNLGGINSPFASWEALTNVLVAGDTGYIRGGTYTNWKPPNGGELYQCYWHNLNGTASDMICIWAYPGEKPVWDFAGRGMTWMPWLVQMNHCNYVHVKGLRIINAIQYIKVPIFGWNLINSSHNIIENCSMDNIGGVAFCLCMEVYTAVNTEYSDSNLFLNCDASRIEDPLSEWPYGGANGFNILHNKMVSNPWATNTTFKGCRAWYCSDDGWDLYGNGATGIMIDNCWSFWNGYIKDTFNSAGDGNGFKLGPTLSDMSTTHQYTVINCLAVHNNAIGFDQNTVLYTGLQHFYNNFAYNNQYIGFYYFVIPAAHVFNNNLAYKNKNDVILSTEVIHLKNSWDAGINISDSDFIGLDETQLTRPRKPDGSLPDIDFGGLNPNSLLKDAGVIIPGIPYNDGGPDIGPEVVLTGPASPVYVSSYVDNSAKSTVLLNYNLSLSESFVPDPVCFSVNANNKLNKVISVEIENYTIRLTLSRPIEISDKITLTYTPPDVDPLQTVYGGKAEGFNDKRVINRVGVIGNQPILSGILCPNPAKNVLNLIIDGEPPSPPLNFKFYTMSGILIDTVSVNQISSKIEIPINLSPNIYLVQIETKGFTVFSQLLTVIF